MKLAASLLQLHAYDVLPKRKMANCCVIFSATVVCLAAFLLGMYYKQVIPEGLPDDQHFSARLYGASWDIFYFMVSWFPFDRYNWAISFNIRTPPVEERWNSSGVRDKSSGILQG